MDIIDADMQEFLKASEGKSVICAGAGNFYRIMCMDIGKRINIAGIIDNNPKKRGNTVDFADISAKVFSPADIIDLFDDKNIVFLITAAEYEGLAESLKSIPGFNENGYFVYSLIKEKNLKKMETFRNELPDALIPPVIHYCWFGGKNIPPHLLGFMESWKKMCPEYEIVRWDESNYDIASNSSLKKAYDAKEWTFVADYVRFDLLYRHGGIYLDTDVEVIKPLDNLRYNHGFIGMEPVGGINAGSGMGSVKGFQTFKDMLDLYDEIGEEAYFQLNTPRETMLFWREGFSIDGGYQVIKDTSVYPYNVLSPIKMSNGEIGVTNCTYCIHHFERSWQK